MTGLRCGGVSVLMGNKTRTLTLSGVFSAFAFVSLYIASIFPMGQVGLVAFASLFVAAAVIDIGRTPGVCVFVVSSALGMLLIPNRAALILYVAFFGYYPVLKSIIEQINKAVLEWALKLLAFNVALSVIWILFRGFIFDIELNWFGIVILFISGSAAFVVFDYGFSKVASLYIYRVSKFTRK